jgi:hypothetical protein
MQGSRKATIPGAARNGAVVSTRALADMGGENTLVPIDCCRFLGGGWEGEVSAASCASSCVVLALVMDVYASHTVAPRYNTRASMSSVVVMWPTRSSALLAGRNYRIVQANSRPVFSRPVRMGSAAASLALLFGRRAIVSWSAHITEAGRYSVIPWCQPGTVPYAFRPSCDERGTPRAPRVRGARVSS